MKIIASHELWLLLLAAPFLLFPGSLGMPAQLAPWIGLGIIALAWIARRLTFGYLTLPTPLDIPIILLVLLGWMGYSISLAAELSWNRLWSLYFGFLIYYAIANWLQTKKEQRYAVWLLVGAVIGVSLLSLIGVDWTKVRMLDLPWLYNRLPALRIGLPGSGAGSLGEASAVELFNPRWVGITLGFLLPPCLSLLLFSTERRLKWAAGLAVLIGACLLLLTQAIQGLVGLAAGLLFLVFWRLRPRLRWLLAGLLVMLGALALILIDLLPSTDSLQLLFDPRNPIGIAVSLRLDIWSRALAMIHDLPYTGVGLNAFPIIQANFYPGFSIGLEPHAHNLFLQTALDFGLPGLAVCVWLIIAWFIAVRKNYRAASDDADRLLLAGVTAGVIAYLAHGFMDALMLGAKPAAGVWFLLALGVATPPGRLAVQPAADRTKHRVWAWAPLVILLAAIALSILLHPVSLEMNRAALRAQGLLYRIEQGQQPMPDAIGRARWALAEVIALDPQRVFAYELSGRLAAWQGDYAAALQFFQSRVDLESRYLSPLRVYFPSEFLLNYRGLTPDLQPSTAEELRRVYTAWSTRYPRQAEHAVRLSLLLAQASRQSDAAREVLANALKQGAQPQGLLHYAQEQLAEGQ